jgi:hypothetical protein
VTSSLPPPTIVEKGWNKRVMNTITQHAFVHLAVMLHAGWHTAEGVKGKKGA